jgi:hypothetical protein
MRYYLTAEGYMFPIKVNSSKEQEKVGRQLQIYIDRLIAKYDLITEFWHCIAEMGYVDDDFPKGRYTLRLTFSLKE